MAQSVGAGKKSEEDLRWTHQVEELPAQQRREVLHLHQDQVSQFFKGVLWSSGRATIWRSNLKGVFQQRPSDYSRTFNKEEVLPTTLAIFAAILVRVFATRPDQKFDTG